MQPSHEVLKEAIEKVGVKAVATELKLSAALVYKWCQPWEPDDPDAGGARNPLDRLAEILRITQDPGPVNWLCHQAGGFFTPNPPIDARDLGTELLKSTQQLVKEFSDMLEEVSRAVANDGAIEPAEAVRIRRDWETLKRVAETFVVRAEAGMFDNGEPPRR